MKPERFRKIDEVFSEALELDPERQNLFLDDACRGDEELRREVDSLLAASPRMPAELDRPALEVEAEALARERSSKKTLDPALPALGSRYQVLGETGRGGMGIVYRARDLETEETVAIKVLHPQIASDPSMLDRFKRELILARRVTHRYVCRIYEINRSGDLIYISMEFVEGESLRRDLNRRGALGVKKAIELIRQVCQGLQEVHAKKIIHRDLKPENIMIDEAGNARIMDFGIARLVTGAENLTIGVAGTPSYMSPEQLGGRDLDERSDIYSLGLIAYELLTGRAAFAGSTPADVAAQQARETPPAPRSIEPAIPVEVEEVILRCIDNDPARRYSSVAEVLAALPSSDMSTNPGPIVQGRKSKISKLFEEAVQIMEPRTARLLLIVIEVGYLALYVAVLYHLDAAAGVLESNYGLSPLAARLSVSLSAIGGMAIRFFLLAALYFNHPQTGRQYWRLFPVLLAFDALWAASPLLLVPHIRGGVALAFTVGMAYLPFSQKTLMSNAFR